MIEIARALRKCGYVRGPAACMGAARMVWWLKPIRRHPNGLGFISSVEHWRWWGYLAVVFTFVCGIVITRVAGSLDAFEGGLPPAFVVAYGVSNICVNFDFAPANMILPLLWVFVLLVVHRLSCFLLPFLQLME